MQTGTHWLEPNTAFRNQQITQFHNANGQQFVDFTLAGSGLCPNNSSGLIPEQEPQQNGPYPAMVASPFAPSFETTEPISAPRQTVLRGTNPDNSEGAKWKPGQCQGRAKGGSKKQCVRGGKPHESGQNLCTRHQQQWKRHHEAPPPVIYESGVNFSSVARDNIYPDRGPLQGPEEEITKDECQSRVETIVRGFIDAVNLSYPQPGKESACHEFHLQQQKVFNGNRHAKKGFTDRDVNIRMRALCEEIIVFHTGGRTVYPQGGDNAGYGEPNKKLTFNERVKQIADLIALDKRVCMDVIEGRGVTALVENPEKFEKRKTQNKDSNAKKQEKQRLGDQLQAKQEAKGKGKTKVNVDEEDDDYSDNEIAGAGDDAGEEWQPEDNADFGHTYMTPRPEAKMGHDQGSDGDVSMADAPTSKKRKRIAPKARAITRGPARKKTKTKQLTMEEVHHVQGQQGDQHDLAIDPTILDPDYNDGPAGSLPDNETSADHDGGFRHTYDFGMREDLTESME